MDAIGSTPDGCQGVVAHRVTQLYMCGHGERACERQRHGQDRCPLSAGEPSKREARRLPNLTRLGTQCIQTIRFAIYSARLFCRARVSLSATSLAFSTPGGQP